jgi:hypothetical protein
MTQVTTLTKNEKRLFDVPPKFSKDERNLYFSLIPELKRTIVDSSNHCNTLFNHVRWCFKF